MTIKQQILLYADKGCSDCEGNGLVSVQVTKAHFMTEDYQYICSCVQSRLIMPPQGDPGPPPGEAL